MRRIMPYISPRRNESLFYLSTDVDVESALEFVEKRNRERPADRPMTLFHLLLRSLSQMFVLRPGINRFVKGGRLWDRNGVYLTFSAKRELVDGAPMLTIKRRFDPDGETLDEMVDAIYAKLRPARAGVESTSDKETKGLMRLPGFVTWGLVRAADGLDALGLLPGFMIEPGPTGRRQMRLFYSYDERVEDGLYASIAIGGNHDRLENPELLLAPTAELARLGHGSAQPG